MDTIKPESANGNGGSRCVQRVVVPLTYPACWILSCDTCRHQEGRHYCLLHGKQMKNMDTITCDQWQDRGGRKRHN